jgi:branched-subunit amino acid ABC-type transport system permease component
MLLSGAMSVAVYLAIFRPALNRGVGPTEMIILSGGVSFLLRYGLILIVGPENLFLNEPSIVYMQVLGLGATNLQLVALALVFAMAGILYWMVYYTGLGEQMRGLANNRELAMASGINPHVTSMAIWFIAGCAGGMSGVFSGVFAQVTPYMGWNVILITMLVTIVAGVGSVRGAFVAAVVAGILTAFITLVTKPLYADVVLLLAFIGVLTYRGARTA